MLETVAINPQNNLVNANILRMKRERAHVSQAAIAKLAGVTKQSVQAFEASARRRKYKSEKREAIIEAYEHLDELRPYSSVDLINGRWIGDQVEVFIRETAIEARGVPDGAVLIPRDALLDLGRRIVLATKHLSEAQL
jgi:transcriptional regulator with XRE-family HTH domain